MYDIRQLMSTEKKIKRVFSDFGRIFVALDGRTDPLRVNDINHLRDLLNLARIERSAIIYTMFVYFIYISLLFQVSNYYANVIFIINILIPI